VFLTSITQKGSGVSVAGRSESNARVSTYMRGVEASPWLAAPELRVIEQKGKGDTDGINTFSMGMRQVVPKAGGKQ
jgi:type IV pilus assembly protein PilN